MAAASSRGEERGPELAHDYRGEGAVAQPPELILHSRGPPGMPDMLPPPRPPAPWSEDTSQAQASGHGSLEQATATHVQRPPQGGSVAPPQAMLQYDPLAYDVRCPATVVIATASLFQ